MLRSCSAGATVIVGVFNSTRTTIRAVYAIPALLIYPLSILFVYLGMPCLHTAIAQQKGHAQQLACISSAAMHAWTGLCLLGSREVKM